MSAAIWGKCGQLKNEIKVEKWKRAKRKWRRKSKNSKEDGRGDMEKDEGKETERTRTKKK